MTKRLFSFAAVSLFASSLAGCGGGGSNGTLVPMTAPSAATSAPMTATLSTTTSGSVPTHVQTGEYLWTATEEATSPSKYAPYLTWAYTKPSLAGPTRATGIKVIVYTNPLMPHGNVYEMTQLNGSYSSVRATTCSGSTIQSWGGKGYLADVRSSSAAAYFKNIEDYYVNYTINGNKGYTHPYDAVYVDDANTFGGLTGNPCSVDADTWTADMDSLISQTGYPTIVNTLSTSEAQVASKVAGLKPANVVGGEYEECFNNGHWQSEEMSQLQTIALLKSQGKAPGPGFWCYLDNTNADASTVIPYRLFAYASFLLTYDPDYSVYQTSFTTPSTFKVLPETGFVPLNPKTQPAQISDLMASSGAYIREYNNCYYRGSVLGACAIIVNPQTYSVSVPNTYQHSMVLSGSGVLDGGSASFTGPAVTTLAPNTAAILVGPSGSAISSAATTPYTVTGKITWVSSSGTKFQVQQSTGSQLYVYYTSTTQSTGGAPKMGLYAKVTGTKTSPVYANTVSVSSTSF